MVEYDLVFTFPKYQRGSDFRRLQQKRYLIEGDRKKLDKVRIDFQFLGKGKQVPVGKNKINYNLIFDVNMYLTEKTRIVTGVHFHRIVLKNITYSSVDSSETR